MDEAQFRMKFSRWLKVRRLREGMSPYDFAFCFKCKISDLRSWEEGKSLPSLYHFYMFVKWWGVPSFL
jgi:DNA-binding transcriptional regulator YiaG